MRYLLIFFRLTVGLVLLFSGTSKLIDPVGTSLVVKEYLAAMHLGFVSGASGLFGVLLSLVEFVTGLALVMRMRMKIASSVALGLLSFFTLLTFWVWLFSPIEDCGCFGEAIHLTNFQTFLKNIILLIFIIPIFLKKNTFKNVIGVAGEWVFLGIYALSITIFTIVSWRTMPLIEFGDFRVGTNIHVKMIEMENGQKEGAENLMYIYEKEGVQEAFELENIPDSTWTFVDVKGAERELPVESFDFSLMGRSGDYITESLLSTTKPMLWCVVYDWDKYILSDRFGELEMLSKQVENVGGEFWVMTTHNDDGVDYPFNMAYSDYKTLISLHRSNGGYIYVEDAILVKKWPSGKFSAQKDLHILEEDPDMAMAHTKIKQQLIYEISIVVLLFSIAIVRYIAKLVSSRRKL